MTGDADFWKWATDLMMLAIGGGMAAIWRMVHGRPTFAQVKELITEHERGSCYARDQRWIGEKFDALEAAVGQANRHIDEVRTKVEEVHLWVQMERRVRGHSDGGHHE